MSNKIIKKIGKGAFSVTVPNVKGGLLILDFNPLIKYFNLSGNFDLIHWQARPRKYREWGIYNSLSDEYLSLAKIDLDGKFTTLQIPDEKAVTLPTAVLYIQK